MKHGFALPSLKKQARTVSVCKCSHSLRCSMFLKRRFCCLIFTFFLNLSIDSTIKRKGTFCGLFLIPLLPSTAIREQPKPGILIDYSKWNRYLLPSLKGHTDLFFFLKLIWLFFFTRQLSLCGKDVCLSLPISFF